jgi:haloalkane dehalogenase
MEVFRTPMEVFRTPDERFENLPGFDFEPNYADVDGLRMHYVDEGAGDPVVCFSDSDPIFPPKAGQRFVDLIPGAGELRVIEGAAHFLQEDKGEEIGAAIDEFIESS